MEEQILEGYKKINGSYHINSLKQYQDLLKELTFDKDDIKFVYRGQKDSRWPVISAAERRLINNNINNINFGKIMLYQDINIIKPIQNSRLHHQIDNFRPLHELEILALMQHFSGATMLIDFSKNALVALWFACQSDVSKDIHDCNYDAIMNDNYKFPKKEEQCGAIYLLNIFDLKIKQINYNDITSNKSLKEIFPEKKSEKNDPDGRKSNEPRLFSWEPGILHNRISNQHSIFIIGDSGVLQKSLIKIIICGEAKEMIRKELKRIHDISDITMFDDFYGFAWANRCDSVLDDFSNDEDGKGGGGGTGGKSMGSGPDGNLDSSSGVEESTTDLKKGPSDDTASRLLEIAISEYQKGNFDEAIVFLNKAISLNPQDPILYYVRGSARTEKGYFDEAIGDYDKVIELDPKNVSAYFNRGNARSDKRYFTEAIEDYTKVIELDPKNVSAYNNRGATRTEKGYFDEAIGDYDKAIELDPKYAYAYNNRGIARIRKGHFDEAIMDCTKAIELDPKNASAYSNRGSAKNAKDDFNGAIDDFTKAIELNPKHAETYYNRGIAKVNKNISDEAIKDFSKAIEINPNFAGAYFNRGIAKSKIDKHNEALEDFKQALKLYDDDMNKKYVTGLICREKGKKEEARKHLEEALAIVKEKKDILMIKEIEKDLKDL